MFDFQNLPDFMKLDELMEQELDREEEEEVYSSNEDDDEENQIRTYDTKSSMSMYDKKKDKFKKINGLSLSQNKSDNISDTESTNDTNNTILTKQENKKDIEDNRNSKLKNKSKIRVKKEKSGLDFFGTSDLTNDLISAMTAATTATRHELSSHTTNSPSLIDVETNDPSINLDEVGGTTNNALKWLYEGISQQQQQFSMSIFDDDDDDDDFDPILQQVEHNKTTPVKSKESAELKSPAEIARKRLYDQFQKSIYTNKGKGILKNEKEESLAIEDADADDNSVSKTKFSLNSNMKKSGYMRSMIKCLRLSCKWLWAILQGLYFIIIDFYDPQFREQFDYSYYEQNRNNLTPQEVNLYRTIRVRAAVFNTMEYLGSAQGITIITTVLLMGSYFKFKRFGTDAGEEG